MRQLSLPGRKVSLLLQFVKTLAQRAHKLILAAFPLQVLAHNTLSSVLADLILGYVNKERHRDEFPFRKNLAQAMEKHWSDWDGGILLQHKGYSRF